MNETVTTLVGTLGSDPVVRTGPRGPFVALRVATAPRWKGPDGDWVEGATSWIDVKANNDLGRNAAACLVKGQRIVVWGTLQVRESQREDGTRALHVEVQATAIGPDLAFGTAQFTRRAGASAARSTSAPTSTPAAATAQPPHAAPEPRPPAPPAAAWNTNLDAEVDVPF